MKTSNIILIAFFSLLGLFLLSFMIQGKRRLPNYVNETKPVTLPQFTHLVIEDAQNISLRQGDANILKIITIQDSTHVWPEYEVRGDTLFVKKFRNTPHYCEIYVSGKISSIAARNANFTLYGWNSDSLRITSHASGISMNEGRIGYLEAEATNGSALTTSKVLKTNVQIDETSNYYSGR